MIARSLEGLPKNARNAILVEPMWALFGVVIMYYAPLYMIGVGLSSAQVGLLGSIMLAFSFVFQTLAATITNRLGRKRTSLIWDLVSWTLPMLIWAFAHDFAAFLLAAILNASVRIVSVSWSLLVIEDVCKKYACACTVNSGWPGFNTHGSSAITTTKASHPRQRGRCRARSACPRTVPHRICRHASFEQSGFHAKE